MFVFISKLMPTLVYPLGLASLLILFALFLTRRPKLQRGVLVLAFVLLWIGGNRWVANSLARSLEQRYPAPDLVPLAEVVVVLGGGTDPLESPRRMVDINSAGDRLLAAASLYRQGKVKHILVSGGLLEWEQRSSTPAQDMTDLLEWLSVPRDAIWQQGESKNTYEDALFSSQFLKEKGIENILLVTSAWHMPRAIKLFQAQGLIVVPVPTDYNVTQTSWDQMLIGDWRSIFLDLFPTVGNLSLTTRMLKEYIGLFVYGLRGWTG